MDKNNFDQLGFPVNDNSDDFGTTRELNSIHDADPEDPSGIALHRNEQRGRSGQHPHDGFPYRT